MSASIRRLATVVTVVLGLALSAVGLSGTAQAAPYISQAALAVGTQNPAEGARLAIRGSGFAASELVRLSIAGQSLGTVTADPSGNFSTTVTLPAGLTGPQIITAVGVTSGKTTTIAITIGTNTGTGGNGTGGTGTGGTGGSGGGLPNTGVAIVGLSAVGLALLIGGAFMLLAGRRRRLGA